MSIFVLSLIIAGGVGVWIYNKSLQRTGMGNNQPAIVGAIVSTIIIFVVLYLTLSTLLD